MNPCRMAAIMYQAAQRLRLDGPRQLGSPEISKSQARRSLSLIDPQTVIESVLSREWGNADANARWRQGRSQLLQAFSALPTGGEVKAFAESVLYRKLNNQLAGRPGAVAAMLQNIEDFEKDLDMAFRDWRTNPGRQCRRTLAACDRENHPYPGEVHQESSRNGRQSHQAGGSRHS